MVTPFTNFVHLTQASSGATANTNTNGDLNTLMNWALPQAGWTRTFHNAGTNESVFRPPSGLRNSLYICHDSSVTGNSNYALVRGCESATNYNALVDPFPLVTQISNTNSNWLLSNSSLSRNFHIYAWESGVVYLTNFNGTPDNWEIGWFVDCWPRFSSDNYYTCIGIRNTVAGTTATGMTQATAPDVQNPSNFVFFMRDVSGVIKSSRGMLDGRGSGLGFVSGAPAIRAGYGNQVERSKLLVHDTSSSTTSVGIAIMSRGAIPNVWYPIHNGLSGVGDNDTLTDTAYDPSATFTLFKFGSNGVIMENTNTNTGFPQG